MQSNGSLWADIFVVQAGVQPDPSDPAYNPNAIHHVRKREHLLSYFDVDPNLWEVLTRYLPKIKQRKVKKLIGGPDDTELEIVRDLMFPSTKAHNCYRKNPM